MRAFQGLFASKHVFAQIKLGEALEMLDVGDLAPRAMTSLLAFLLSELEEPIATRGAGAAFSAIGLSLIHI